MPAPALRGRISGAGTNPPPVDVQPGEGSFPPSAPSDFTFVCCLRASPIYSPVWVARLVRQVQEHWNPRRIVCLSDVTVQSCERLSLFEKWPGWWAKIAMFRPGLLSDLCIYADLDTLVCAPIPNLVEALMPRLQQVPLAMIDDLGQTHLPQSGVLAWIPGPHTEQIYHAFARHPQQGMQTRYGDGGFIGRFSHFRLQRVFPGLIKSFRIHGLNKGPGGAAIVCLHGPKKQQTFPADHWIHRHWLGTKASDQAQQSPASRGSPLK